ncbi:hypothetical protein, partial [Streptomyces xanthochromogenes]
MTNEQSPGARTARSVTSPVAERAGWDEVDVRAVDTVRLLAADAVQKVGNGHPGTAPWPRWAGCARACGRTPS